MDVNRIKESSMVGLSSVILHQRSHMLKNKCCLLQETLLVLNYSLKNGYVIRLIHKWSITKVTIETLAPSNLMNHLRTVTKVNFSVRFVLWIKMLKMSAQFRPLCTWHSSAWFIQVYIGVLMALIIGTMIFCCGSCCTAIQPNPALEISHHSFGILNWELLGSQGPVLFSCLGLLCICVGYKVTR